MERQHQLTAWQASAGWPRTSAWRLLSVSAPEQPRRWQRLIIRLVFFCWKRCSFPFVVSCWDIVSFCQGIWKNSLGPYGIKWGRKKSPQPQALIKTLHSSRNRRHVLILIVLVEEALRWWFLRLSGCPLPGRAAESWGWYRSHSSACVLCQPAGQELFSNPYTTYNALLRFHESWSVLSVKPYFITKSATW